MDRTEKILYNIWLTKIPGIGRVTARRLMDYFKNPEEIYKADGRRLEESGIGKEKICSLINNRSLEYAESIWNDCMKKGIGFIIPGDPFFKRFAVLGTEAPFLLYIKGDLREVCHTAGIVGSRRCTQAAKRKTAELAEKYTKAGYIIVSGMAKGIDSYAHTACINAGGYTIAVLGNGLDICYPKEHDQLMEAIACRGLLVSEYSPGTRPSSYHFPLRNRLIAALSDELAVMDPGKRSGAMITLECADRIGRPVRIYR